MSETIAVFFLNHSVRKLDQMTAAIDLCLASLTPAQIWSRGGDHENAIGNLVLHLCGNVNQWIGHTIAGAPDTRDRPSEFAGTGANPEAGTAALTALLHSTVANAKRVLEALPHARLTEIVATQDGGRSVLEAIYQCVGHFQQHTGQIVFATKQLTGRDLEIYKA